jgi:hypothetical protein
MCFSCHENNEDSPLKETHTPERECFECHKRTEKINEEKKDVFELKK